MTQAGVSGAIRCDRCRTEIAPAFLRCPACGALAHAGALSDLVAQARRAEAGGDFASALQALRQAELLLPQNATQRPVLAARIANLEPRLQADAASPAVRPPRGILAALVAGVLFLLGKGKLLLLGLTKLSTLLSMLAFAGVYWGAYGWRFAVGIVLSIYVHEMGHVASLRRYGIPASPPMFIPGLGAFVRLKAHPATPGQDARVGLAGPHYGAAAALACYGLFRWTGNGLFASLTHFGAVINIFNLFPVWQLDGGRGIRPLARSERLLLLGAVAAAFLLSREGMLLLVGLGVGARCLERNQGEGDGGALAQFVWLVLLLGCLAVVRGAPAPSAAGAP